MKHNSRVDIKSSSAYDYESSSIAFLTGVEAIRRHPALYVGSSGNDGVHHLVYELVENAVDEHQAGACSEIRVELLDDGSCSVSDDGRGIPFGNPTPGARTVAERLFTELHSGGKFDQNSYTFSAGLHGLGLTCVNALSEWLNVKVVRDGQAYAQNFARGVPQEPNIHSLQSVGRGTTIQFKPDQEIFRAGSSFSYERIAGRLNELASLNPGLSISIRDVKRYLTFCSSEGLVGLLKPLTRGEAVVHKEPVTSQVSTAGTSVELALRWRRGTSEKIIGFVNSVRTDYGTHISLLREVATGVARKLAHTLGLAAHDEELIASDVMTGLNAVVSVRMRDAQYSSQTKSHLVTDEFPQELNQLLSQDLERQLNANHTLRDAIIEHVLTARRARVSSERPFAGTRYAPLEMPQSLDVYRKQFGIRSSDWHESCDWLTDRDLLAAHAAACEVEPSATMLDVCCGSGIVGASFAGRVKRMVGLDITPEMRALAEKRLDEVHAGSIYEMPFGGESFDLVVTREVFHLLPRLARPLSEIFRVLRPNGQLIFGQTVPYGPADAAWTFRIFKKKQPLFYNNYLAEDFVELLHSAGFVDVSFTEMHQWENIDRWIDSHETSARHRAEIRELYFNAPSDVRDAHPFEIQENGQIRDRWRWCIFSARKPA